MSAPIAKSQFAFELPNLSYVDAKLEEPNLRAFPQPVVAPQGFGAWLASCVAAVANWRKQQAALAELEMMTDHELMDIGLTRGDFGRVFDADHNRDLVRRGAAA
jgi:uncharacterized protein YjiS (DUF1127 family)